MDEIETIAPKTLKDSVSTLKYAIALTALAAFAAAIYAFLPESNVSAQISEAEAGAEPETPEIATQDMIDFALNLKSASGYTVYAERGITERGNSEIRGAKGDAMRSAEGRKSTKDLSNSIDALRQLPCTELKSGALAGRSFTPGVYCLSSAELDGEMVIDGQGSAAGTFIFRVAGSLVAKSNSSIRVTNGAQGGNVYFVAENAEIGAGSSFRAHVLASGDIKVGAGATVTDKVMALGKVDLNDSALLGGTTGTMKICAEQPLPVEPSNDISNRVFHYVVTGATGVGTAANPVRVAVGTCSALFDVTAGPQTVTELNTGGLVVPPTGSFEGNFELIEVADLTPTSPSSLGLVNLATRTANVNVVAGGEADQITLRFTNRHAITGFIEICARAATGPRQFNPAGTGPFAGGDPDVTGFFQYTIEDVFTTSGPNPNARVLQVFTIPVGQCTGPIPVTKGDPAPFGTPISTVATVSMLPRAGTYFETADVIPSERQIGFDIRGFIVGVTPTGEDVLIPAPGGGYVDVLFPASTSPLNETLVVTRIRSNPARVKICKIAGPGVPIDTLFRFTVTGTGALNAALPQSAQYGPVTRTVDVRAGNPAQGGSCQFVPGFGANPPGYSQFQTFVNGTPVTIVENGLSPDNTVPQNPGQLRVSQIRLFGSSFVSGAKAGFTPNPDTTTAPDRIARASVLSRFATTEVEFSGFRFNPTVLKVCKKGLGVTQGQDFTFTISTVSPTIGGANPGNMFPPFSQNLTVTAGSSTSTEGNCAFVNGASLPGGAFNQGSTVKVVEASGLVHSIMSPSAGTGGLAVDIPNRSATFSGPNGIVAGINSVIFTNGPCGPVPRPSDNTGSNSRPACTPPPTGKIFDFDGDFKSDPAVFSPSQGRFSFLSSAEGYQILSRDFGVTGDRPVAADYDGDEKTDYAVWRPSTGVWYLQRSHEGYTGVQWGQLGDIPQTGDFDGDLKADLVVFRPSNATWYIRTSSSGQSTAIQFGIATDKPYARDYDGDGKTDLGVFRNGVWYTLESTRGFRAIGFGQAGDAPVPGDYDGDGHTNIAVYRPSEATWYVLRADGNYYARQFGSISTATIPVPADYDGDGKADLAYFRPDEGKWYLRHSSIGEPDVRIFTLGAAGDIPLQAPDATFGTFETVIF